MFKWGIPAPRGRHRCFGMPDLLALFLQKNLSGSADRSARAACRSDKVSTKGPGAGGSCGLSPPGAVEPPSLPGAACFSPLQDQKILLSIYNISMSLQEVAAGTLRGPEELAVRKVARNTDFVLRENCRKISKVGALPLPSQAQWLPVLQHVGCGQSLPCCVLSWLPMRSLQALPAASRRGEGLCWVCGWGMLMAHPSEL